MTLEEAQKIGDIVAATINTATHGGCDSCNYRANKRLNETFPQFAWRFATKKDHSHDTYAEVLNGP